MGEAFEPKQTQQVVDLDETVATKTHVENEDEDASAKNDADAEDFGTQASEAPAVKDEQTSSSSDHVQVHDDEGTTNIATSAIEPLEPEIKSEAEMEAKPAEAEGKDVDEDEEYVKINKEKSDDKDIKEKAEEEKDEKITSLAKNAKLEDE